MVSLGFTLFAIGAITGLLLLSAFFSSSEIAIFTLTDDWLATQATSSDPQLQTLRSLRRNPHRLLVTILVGNNVVNVAIASTTTALLIEFLPTGSAVSIATVVTSFVVLIFGEIVPKSYGLGNAEAWAPRVAGPIRLMERLLSPLVVLLDVLTRRLNSVIGGQIDIEQPFVDE